MRKLRIVLDSVLNFSSGASGSEIKLNFYLFRDTKFPKMSKNEEFLGFKVDFSRILKVRSTRISNDIPVLDT